MSTGTGPRLCPDYRRQVPPGTTRCAPCRRMQAIHLERHRQFVARFEAGSREEAAGTISLLGVEIERPPEALEGDRRKRRPGDATDGWLTGVGGRLRELLSRLLLSVSRGED